MTESEILVAWGGLTGLVVSIVSVGFGMVSAYIVGLWLFLKEAPIALRLTAFLMLSCGMTFMAILAWGLHELFVGTDRAWAKLETTTTDIPVFFGRRPDVLQGLSIYEFGVGLGFLAFGFIYATLGYLTFFYRWPDRSE